MRLTQYLYTNPGGRELNEDSIRSRASEDRQVFVVCDGLGGHDCGEVASALAADTLAERCCAAELGEEAMKDALIAANDAVLAAQDSPERKSMKTTAAVLATDGTRAVWGHVGDSRVYHLSGGRISSITKDHSVTYKKYLAGEISYLDIHHDDDRPSLLRALGKRECRPDSGSADLKPGDAFLLCSDGFWEYVYDEEIVLDFLKSDTPEQWVEFMLLRLVRRTPPNHDNFSVIAVFAEAEL